MERHQGLQRMRAGQDERADVLADEAALADVDHLFGGRALLTVQLVFLGDTVEVVDDPLAEFRAVARLEEQLVQAVPFGRRVLVEEEALVLERPAWLRRGFHLVRDLAVREETHHAQAVMPRGDVVDELALLRANRAEHDGPAEHLGVAHLVELRAAHVEQRVDVPDFELRQQPAVEVEFRMQILRRPREVRHAAAGDDGDAFFASLDDLGERFAKRRAARRRRQRRNVDVREKRNDRNVALADHVLERNGKRMTELRVFRVRDVEVVVLDELVQDVFRHLSMDRQLVLAARELRVRRIAGDHAERRHATHGKRLDVIGAEEDDDVRLGLVEHLAELVHAAPRLVELFRVLVRRTSEHVGGMTRPDSRYDFAHVFPASNP